MNATTKVKLKFFLLLFGLIIGINHPVSAQESIHDKLTEDVQEFPLKDNKIMFYEAQMDLESVRVESTDKNYSGEKPKVNINKVDETVTIDFTTCEAGTYFIHGTRGELALTYRVEKKNN